MCYIIYTLRSGAGRDSEFLSHHVRALHTANNCVIQWWKVMLPLSWNHVLLSHCSTGTIAALLHEIVNIYAVINPPNLTVCFGPLTALVWCTADMFVSSLRLLVSPKGPQSNRVCNALALLQCVASHPETRSAFLQGVGGVGVGVSVDGWCGCEGMWCRCGCECGCVCFCVADKSHM